MPPSFVESKFFFFNIAHAFGDVIQEDVRLNFKHLPSAGDLSDCFQNSLDVPSLDGGNSVGHVLDELVVAELVGGLAQDVGKL